MLRELKVKMIKRFRNPCRKRDQDAEKKMKTQQVQLKRTMRKAEQETDSYF